MSTPGWTLDELVAQAAAALRDARPGSRRVRQVPDRRSVRWYTTIGLLDRPVLRGRTGWYGRRHLLQLVAIKRLQAAGRSLAAIQAELAGTSDATLRRLAGLPDDRVDAAPDPTSPSRSGRFWAESAAAGTARAETAPAAVPGPGPSPAGVGEGAAPPPRVRADPPALRLALDLAPGVTLLVCPGDGGPPGEGDLAELREAARPLLDLLARRGLAAAASRPHPPSASRPHPSDEGDPR